MYRADSVGQKLKGRASPLFTDMSPVIGTKPKPGAHQVFLKSVNETHYVGSIWRGSEDIAGGKGKINVSLNS